MQIKAVLFDLDGTLIDTIPDLTYGLNQMLKELDKPPLTTVQVSSMVGRGVIDLMENVFRASRLAVSSDAINKAISVYCDIMVRSGSSHSTVFPDVFESLARLRASGMKVAIVTNKPRNMTEAIVREKTLPDASTAWSQPAMQRPLSPIRKCSGLLAINSVLCEMRLLWSATVPMMPLLHKAPVCRCIW